MCEEIERWPADAMENTVKLTAMAQPGCPRKRLNMGEDSNYDRLGKFEALCVLQHMKGMLH